MAQYTVTAVDTTGIQPYIFGSNRLRENIGASELVRLATGKWALETVKEVSAGKHNIKSVEPLDFTDDFIEVNDLAAEVIYAGGGNIVIIFRFDNDAKEFARKLTRKALVEAPGLSLVVAHSQFNWNATTALSKVVGELISQKLAERKAARLPSVPLLGLGVTAACQSTGLVAVQTDEDWKPKGETQVRLISRETRSKLAHAEVANNRLEELFKDGLAGWFEFPYDIDNLGRVKGEESYLAVVHADGNGMGKRIKAIANSHSKPQDNRLYIKEMRSFSKNLNEAATNTLRQIVMLLTRSLRFAQERDLIADKIPLEHNKQNKKYRLPFRPLVFGGDDVTFVCNAQIGLSLAAEYLKAFEEETAKLLCEKMYSRAGIAMVKMHYPFARAYSLSEELAKSAKSFLRDKDASALDWHFATGGLSGSLMEIRQREYELVEGSLLMRPLLLHPETNDQTGRAWFERIERLVREFQDNDTWRQKRNKVKALREALRGGESEVRRFLASYEIDRLPRVLMTSDDHQKMGWNGRQCVYFDAIELMDQYIDLREYA